MNQPTGNRQNQRSHTIKPKRTNGQQRRPTTLNYTGYVTSPANSARNTISAAQPPSTSFDSWGAWVAHHKGLNSTTVPTAPSIKSDSNGRWQEGFELSPLSASDEKYRWIKDKMEKSIVEHHGTKIGGYELVEVYHVKNADLWKKYSTRRREIYHEMNGERVEEVRLFHGTNNADAIAQNGFKIELAKHGGMFGKAIYFTNLSSKSNQYTFEGYNVPCRLHRDVHCDQCIRSMLLCRVALGKEYLAPVAMNGTVQPPSGYHCIVGDPKHCRGLRYKEYAIFDNNQAYPGHLIKYRINKSSYRQLK